MACRISVLVIRPVWAVNCSSLPLTDVGWKVTPRTHFCCNANRMISRPTGTSTFQSFSGLQTGLCPASAGSLVAVFIACLGLFGLAAYAAQQRVKEIGVRKVLGASVPDIAKLLSMDFVRLVLVAIVIASPIAWWVMHSWLESFPYRTMISWWVFVVAGISAIVIAMGTVGVLAVKAANANPIHSLRNE